VAKEEDAVIRKAGTPVPERATVWGLSGVLYATVNVPVRTPAAVGVNVTLTLQVSLDARGELHVFVCEKSVGDVVTPVMLMGVVPIFLIVLTWAALAICTPCDPKD
jgi:hypothetical protein